MKRTNKDISGTSFHDITVTATRAELIDAIGQPDCEGSIEDKSQYDWFCETEDGNVFTIYDWKEYYPHAEDVQITWHIGAHSWMVSSQAKEELMQLINSGIKVVNQ